MSAAARYTALGFGVFAHYGILISTCLPYWRVSSWQISDSLYGRIPTFDGIWWQCMSLKKGGFTCNNHGAPTLYVDMGIQMCRGLMTSASFLSFMALIGTMLTLQCSVILGVETKAKRIVAIVSGVSYVVAGACVLVATAWYAYRVTYEFYSPYYQEREFKYDYGPCLYLGWVSMGFAYLSAGLLIFRCNCGRPNFNRFSMYRPPPRPLLQSTYNRPVSIKKSTSKKLESEYV